MEYTVTLARRRYDYADIIVEADSEDAAQKAAWDIACEGNTDWKNEETDSIYAINAKESQTSASPVGAQGHVADSN